jgi:hypothetical protein
VGVAEEPDADLTANRAGRRPGRALGHPLGELVTLEYDGLPVNHDQLHRARELVMEGVSALDLPTKPG